MTVEEYLRTSFEELDHEYVDGDIVTRSMPPWEHARVQQLLILAFAKWMNEPGLLAVPELRSQTSETKFRIPDVSVHLGAPQKPPIDRPPFIAIEILSPDDKMVPLLAKFEEYRAWGVAHIWLVNPMALTLHIYTSDGLIKQSALRIPEFSLSIPPEEVFPPECVSQ